ncbi:MAG TPA: Lrp/AsnC ligand binding domain-containing protein [Candidatus Acidoferrales bacterium]|nr:Lrp/AsnC ligand binding domain-containing protein [Candidatus Acidoferrales bacterium]
MRAFVLLNVHAGKCPAVVGKVRKIEGVVSANACWGRPDIFVIVDAPSQSALADTVIQKIQDIDGVESTDTHIVID